MKNIFDEHFASCILTAMQIFLYLRIAKISKFKFCIDNSTASQAITDKHTRVRFLKTFKKVTSAYF